MGCTSVEVSKNSRPVIKVKHEKIKQYIDHYPLIVVYKLKQKFESFTNARLQMSFQNFILLYKHLKWPQRYMWNLYLFFSNGLEQDLKFRSFMIQYALITQCQSHILRQIICSIYNNSVYNEQISQETLIDLAYELSEYLSQPSDLLARFKQLEPDQKLSKNKLCEWIEQGKFLYKKYQNIFNLISQDDIPIKKIKQQLNNQEEFYVPGKWYFIISQAWFQRWAFYYLDQDHSIKQSKLKSIKVSNQKSLLKKYLADSSNNNSISHFQNKINKELNNKTIRRSSFDSINQNTDQSFVLITQPIKIQFEQICGQYQGQLKNTLNCINDVKIINQTIWKLFQKLHPVSTNQFCRQAIDERKIQFHLKTIYFYTADKKGNINFKKHQTLNVSGRKKIKQLKENEQVNSKFNYIYFYKQFKQKNWKQISNQSKLSEISSASRLFIVKTICKSNQFLSLHHRENIQKDNFTLGDEIKAHFDYKNCLLKAFILRICQNNTFYIHFQGQSYCYEKCISAKFIYQNEVDQQPLIRDQNSKTIQKTGIKGIYNIGNTCFMNSIVQCLIATPIMDQYLEKEIFNSKKYPMTSKLSDMAKKLLKNISYGPQDLKKAVNNHMPAFVGYNQHDAQQFLNMFLNKMSEQEQNQQRTSIIEDLFSGVVQSALVCQHCKAQKRLSDKIYTLSLSIKQPQYLYYTIIIIPVESKKIRKIVIKLSRQGTMKQFINQFQSRYYQNIKQFIFVQINRYYFKKIRLQFQDRSLEHKKMKDCNLSSQMEFYAFTKINKRFHESLRVKNKVNMINTLKYFDYYDEKNKMCGIVRILKQNQNEIQFEFLGPSNDIDLLTLNSSNKNKFFKLGLYCNDNHIRQVTMRKLNPVLEKIEQFGLSLVINIMNWFSYNDLIAILEKYTQNFRCNINIPLQQCCAIRLIDNLKHECLFCGKIIRTNHVDKILSCCIVREKDIPLPWLAYNFNYSIYLDWYILDNYNSSFKFKIDIDYESACYEKARKQDKTSLLQSLNIFTQPQQVEMQCDRCQKTVQNLYPKIGKMPSILVLHMKQYQVISNNLQKMNINLKWQEYLDISKFTNASKGTLYQLYALVKHHGGAQFGHYTCMTRRQLPQSKQKVWVNFDDQFTTIITNQQDQIKDAYLLFFQKVDMPTSALVNFAQLN